MGALDSAWEAFNVFYEDFIAEEKAIIAIDKITLDDLNQYHATLLNNNKLKIFSLGNLKCEFCYANAVAMWIK
ncbi:hypothetical protein GKC56_05480 [Neisseriaceae bacterium PsAf]|nr:hypothetical protein [Neisseriaceae bacterium PsAf]